MVKRLDWGPRGLPRSTGILFACALAAIILDALLFHYVTRSIAVATEEIIAARAQVDNLVAARDLLLDAETGARGFLLTDRPEFLEPFDSASARASTILNAIAAAPHDNASEQAQAGRFLSLAHAKLEELARTIDIYRAGDHGKAVEMVASGIEKRAMDEIRALVQGRQRVLQQRIEVVRAERGQIIRWALVANTAAACAATCVLIFLGVATSRHLFRRQKLEHEIQSSKIELERMVAQRTRELEDSVETIRAQLDSRMQREKMLRDSEQRFSLLVAGVKDYAIYMLDPEGHVTSWNSGAERIKGYSAAEIIGKHFSLFYTEEDRNANVPQQALLTAFRDGKYEAESIRVRKDGSRFVASVVIDPLRDDSGRHIGFAKITRDVTERHQHQAALDEAKAALAQSQKMEALGQLSGGIAHDFNNVLHVMKNAGEILDRRLPGSDPDLRKALDMIRRNIDRAASLTQRLLAFARRQPLEPRPINPSQLVQSMDPLLKSALGEVIDLQVVCGSGTWPVSIDPNQLETVILNLAINARDAMPEGGKLTIETTNAYIDEGYAVGNKEAKPGQYALISVSDTGTGMSPEVIAKAFEPFFTTKELGHGTGLGLSQVYGFIKQSGGHVKIYSELGRGTSVKLYLPRLGMAPAQAQDAVQSVPNGAAKETILLVEDEEDVRTFTATVLRELGYRVLTAVDAKSALAVMESEPSLDLLFTDVGLPNGMNGQQLADEVGKHWPALKVLYTTGYAHNAIIHHGRLDPRVDLIVKPFSQSSLANKIRKVLDTPPSDG
jgi:PAS domain S-box-containing protein